VENPETDKETGFMSHLNANSLLTLADCRLEPGLAAAGENDRYQFERLGYFCLDYLDSTPVRPVFNRTVTLRDSWEKIEKNG